jgi:DNA-binding GntR family transcriptional regulator
MTIGPQPDSPAAPIERPGSLKDAAYREIKSQLVSGKLAHDKIYSAQHFAAMLGVSRTPVREALLQLAGEGFLVCLDVRGFRVRQFSEREIRDVFETRHIIETFVVKQLLEKFEPADVRHLHQNLRTMTRHAKAGNAHGFLEADKEFHMWLVRRTGNQMLVGIMDNIRIHMAIFGLKALAHPGRFQEVIREHRSILRALYHKDKKRALLAVHHHLANTEKYLFEQDQPVNG